MWYFISSVGLLIISVFAINSVLLVLTSVILCMLIPRLYLLGVDFADFKICEKMLDWEDDEKTD